MCELPARRARVRADVQGCYRQFFESCRFLLSHNLRLLSSFYVSDPQKQDVENFSFPKSFLKFCCRWLELVLCFKFLYPPSSINQVPSTRTSKQVAVFNALHALAFTSGTWWAFWSDLEHPPLLLWPCLGCTPDDALPLSLASSSALCLGLPLERMTWAWIFPSWRRGWIFLSWFVWELRPASSSFKEKELLFSEVMGHQLLTPGCGCTESWMGIPWRVMVFGMLPVFCIFISCLTQPAVKNTF